MMDLLDLSRSLLSALSGVRQQLDGSRQPKPSRRKVLQVCPRTYGQVVEGVHEGLCVGTGSVSRFALMLRPLLPLA